MIRPFSSANISIFYQKLATFWVFCPFLHYSVDWGTNPIHAKLSIQERVSYLIGCLDKNTGVEALQTHPSVYGWIIYTKQIGINNVNGSRLAKQGPLPSRYSWQENIGCHQANPVTSKRKKWSSQENKIVMEWTI